MKHCLSLFFIIGFLQNLSAQHVDSLKTEQRKNYNLQQLYIPSALIISGVAFNGNGPNSIKNEVFEERNEYFVNFRTKADDYLQYSPIVIAYGLDALGVKSKTGFADRTAILLKGEFFMTGSVKLLKKATYQLRPDGSTYDSFPSGHTAQAFAAATFLSTEYKQRLKWIPYAAYGLATSVGLLRVANNRHFISDVFTGAGLGILSMKLSYWTHQYKWSKKEKQINLLIME